MESLIYIAIGVVNGVFTSGAGQLLIFYLVYILKQDTKKSRELSLAIMPLISIPTFIFYINKSNIELKISFFLVIISLTFGILGNIIMKKINPLKLNLISGIFLVIVTSISLWRIIWYI